MEIAIALIQLDIAPGDPLKNMERMDQFVRQAKKQGADLVIFPEDAVCGPLRGQLDFVAHAPDYLAHFQALALKHAIDIAAGELPGPQGNAVLSGRSQLTHPLDKVVCKAEGNAEEVLFAKLILLRAPLGSALPT